MKGRQCDGQEQPSGGSRSWLRSMEQACCGQTIYIYLGDQPRQQPGTTVEQQQKCMMHQPAQAIWKFHGGGNHAEGRIQNVMHDLVQNTLLR